MPEFEPLRRRQVRLDFQSEGGWVRFTLPKSDNHAMMEM